MQLFNGKLPVKAATPIGWGYFVGYAYREGNIVIFEEVEEQAVSVPERLCLYIEKDFADRMNPGFAWLDVQNCGVPTTIKKYHGAKSLNELLEQAIKDVEDINETAYAIYSNTVGLGLPTLNDCRVVHAITSQSIDEFLELVEADDYVKWDRRKDGFIHTEYIYNGTTLFDLKNHDMLFEEIITKVGVYRHLAMAYRQLRDDECLGIEVDDNQNLTLLGASVQDGEVVIRRVENFKATKLLMSDYEERPPYFVIEDGEFSGIGMTEKGLGQYCIGMEDDLTNIFIGWVSVLKSDAFGLSSEQRARLTDVLPGPEAEESKNIEVEGLR